MAQTKIEIVLSSDEIRNLIKEHVKEKNGIDIDIKNIDFKGAKLPGDSQSMYLVEAIVKKTSDGIQ